MMRDHPLGVGWNQAVSVYDKNYSPPKDGAAALTMNSYLMLGTELGLPGLLCFVAYVGLCLHGKGRMQNEECRIQTACRAGAIVLLVAFWFDGGLFDLPTAAVFWVLLELGNSNAEVRMRNEEVKAESGRQFRHLTPALSPDEAEREPKSAIVNRQFPRVFRSLNFWSSSPSSASLQPCYFQLLPEPSKRPPKQCS
jgi:O-antigen ligase